MSDRLIDNRYRSGYSDKDPGQARVLALKMRHRNFKELLAMAHTVSGQHGELTKEQKEKPVRVQWDPERTPDLERLPYRSIQIGIGGSEDFKKKWVDEWIVSIEDVTQRAKDLKAAILSFDKAGAEGLTDEHLESLVKRGLVPEERVYEVDKELRDVLRMDLNDS
jgi:Domain of unknown function (DUF4291)